MGVLYGRFALRDNRYLRYLRVLQERAPGRQYRSSHRPELHLLRGGHELDELPRFILHVRLGIDEHVPPTETAGQVLALLRRQRSDTHLILLQVTLCVEIRVAVRPLSGEDRVPWVLEKGRVCLSLLIGRDGLRRYAARQHAGLGGQTCGRLGAIYDDLVGVARVEHVTAVLPDVLQSVAHPTLVGVALEDEAVLDPLVLRDLIGHLLELVPRLGGF